jgi:predicted RNase H-like nuclease (RuvC/YqgF family)
MEPKNSKIFSREIMQAVTALCESKGIKDVDNFIYLCFKQGFDIRKYGLLGGEVSGEVTVEVSGEVPVEVIKEVEKIVEVPVDRIVEVIKEVPVEIIKEVEKIIYTSDDTQVNELLLKIEQLNGEISTKTGEIDIIRQEFSTKTEEMENIFQNKMSKKDEELDILVTNNRVNMLQETLQNLRIELQQKNEQIKELEKINRELLNGNQNQGYLMRGSNLNRRI